MLPLTLPQILEKSATALDFFKFSHVNVLLTCFTCGWVIHHSIYIHLMILVCQWKFHGVGYLIDNVFIVANVVLKRHDRFPGVILGVNAAAGGFTVFMTGYSEGISGKRTDL